MERLGGILESIGFKKGDIPETWKGIFEDIIVNICVHPLKGICLSYYHAGKRSALEDEIFIALDSNKQQITQALLRIHENVYGK
jgi:hypothetical protein